MNTTQVNNTTIPASAIEAGMVVKLRITQAWCKKANQIIPLLNTLVIKSTTVDANTQIAEWQGCLLDIWVMDVLAVSCPNNQRADMLRLIHCVDQSQEHSIYIMPNELVEVIGNFSLNSK